MESLRVVSRAKLHIVAINRRNDVPPVHPQGWRRANNQMVATPLTARQLATLKPPETGRLELTDGLTPGLKFRLTARGRASWSLQLRVNGEQRRFSLGAYPALGLAAAREKAASLRQAALHEGHDPIREARSEKQLVQSLTLAEAIENYTDLHLAQLRRGAERRRQIEAGLGHCLDAPIAQLTRADLQQAIDLKAREGRIVQANRLRSALLHFVGWAWRRRYLPEHIGADIERAGRERVRERVLTLDEVQAIYLATFDLAEPMGACVRVLLLTAQRRGEVAGMLWSEIDRAARLWQIPASTAKNRNPHRVPLSAPVLDELDRLASYRVGDLVFTTTGHSPVQAWSKTKRRLDYATAIEDWRFHDFRTAFATHLAEAGENESVVDRVLNHVATGSAPSAVARVYNRAELLPQRARALQRWADMVDGHRGVVVPLEAGDSGRGN